MIAHKQARFIRHVELLCREIEQAPIRLVNAIITRHGDHVEQTADPRRIQLFILQNRRAVADDAEQIALLLQRLNGGHRIGEERNMLAIVLVKMAAERFHRRVARPPPQRNHLRKVFLALAVAALDMRFHLIHAPCLFFRGKMGEELLQKSRAVGPIGRLTIL